MQYRIEIIRHGASAKNKGLIAGRWFLGRNEDVQVYAKLTIEAANNEDAYRKACEAFNPDDRRLLAGKSYLRHAALRPRRIGERVKLLRPYGTIPGLFEGYREGIISEIVSSDTVSVEFPGYHTRFVDFHLAELKS